MCEGEMVARGVLEMRYHGTWEDLTHHLHSYILRTILHFISHVCLIYTTQSRSKSNSLLFQNADCKTPIASTHCTFLKNAAAFPLLVLVIPQFLQFFCAFFLHAQIPMSPDD